MTSFDSSKLCDALKQEVPAGLDERVIERVDALGQQAGFAEARGQRGRVLSAPVSRRGVLAGAAAAAAGLGAAALGLRFWVGDSGGELAGLPSSGRAFGLQVAMAAESSGVSQEVFALEPTAKGLVPVGETSGRVADLRMNLAVVGEGLASVRFAISQTPEATTYLDTAVVDLERGMGYTSAEYQTVPAVGFHEGKRYVELHEPEYPVFSSAEEARAWSEEQMALSYAERTWSEDAAVPDSELEVDYASGLVRYLSAPGEEGQSVPSTSEFEVEVEPGASGCSGLSRNGNPYLLHVCIPMDEFYASDPILQLIDAYDRAERDYGAVYARHIDSVGALFIDQHEEVRAASQARFDAQSALVSALGELRSSERAFYEWVRACYGTHLRLVARMLEETTLGVEATYLDGSGDLRRYCVRSVADFDTVVANRFDALFTYNGYTLVESEGIYDRNGRPLDLSLLSQLPFWNFVTGEPDPNAPDPRLKVPLFEIALV